MGRLLCKLGFHYWRFGFDHEDVSGFTKKCRRCSYQLWGLGCREHKL